MKTTNKWTRNLSIYLSLTPSLLCHWCVQLVSTSLDHKESRTVKMPQSPRALKPVRRPRLTMSSTSILVDLHSSPRSEAGLRVLCWQSAVFQAKIQAVMEVIKDHLSWIIIMKKKHERWWTSAVPQGRCAGKMVNYRADWCCNSTVGASTCWRCEQA